MSTDQLYFLVSARPLFWALQALGLILICSGLRRAVRSSAKVTKRILAFLLIAQVGFLLLEFGIRIYDARTRKHSFFHNNQIFRDRVLGWEYKFDPQKNKGAQYKILILGDSFTQGAGVSSHDMYYQRLRDFPYIETTAAGGGGFGTLQEYLLLRRYFAQIKPDLILLQVTDNDFVDNDADLNSKSLYSTLLFVRPYLEGDNIVYRTPCAWGVWRLFLAAYSRVFDDYFRAIQACKAARLKEKKTRSIEGDISEKGLTLGSFRRASSTTRTVIKKIKEFSGPVPVIAFCARCGDPQRTEFKTLFAKEGIPFIDQTVVDVDKAEKHEGLLRVKDGYHWNARGNFILGVSLVEALKKIPGPDKFLGIPHEESKLVPDIREAPGR